MYNKYTFPTVKHTPAKECRVDNERGGHLPSIYSHLIGQSMLGEAIDLKIDNLDRDSIPTKIMDTF